MELMNFMFFVHLGGIYFNRDRVKIPLAQNIERELNQL